MLFQRAVAQSVSYLSPIISAVQAVLRRHPKSAKMQRGKGCSVLAGLLGGLVVGAAALLGNVPHADAGLIKLNSDFGGIQTPDVFLYHEEGGTEGFDSGLDLDYSASTPAVDFYSMIPGHNLSIDLNP